MRVRIEKIGFRTRCLWFATTLSDAKSYPAELYYRRWSIELLISLRFTLRAAFGCLSLFVQLYRDVKTTMHLEAPRTKSPAMIEKKLLMHAIAYNSVRALILQSAAAHQQELERISFKAAVDLLRQWLPQAAACHDQPRKLAKWHEELLVAIASVPDPLRPERREPRAKKRRPKNYQLLTRPRHKFQENPHRERYRAASLILEGLRDAVACLFIRERGALGGTAIALLLPARELVGGIVVVAPLAEFAATGHLLAVAIVGIVAGIGRRGHPGGRVSDRFVRQAVVRVVGHAGGAHSGAGRLAGPFLALTGDVAK